MRRDMAKVIVERPRGHGHYTATFSERRHRFERGSRDREDHDVLPFTMPTRFGRTSCLNENLAPLERFLRRRVGRPWDEVYSEIRAQLAPRRTLDVHVLDHVRHYVGRTRRRDHVVWLVDHRGRFLMPLAESATFWRSAFYVCCDTGTLCARPYAPRRPKQGRAP